jgi:hypothetical protein
MKNVDKMIFYYRKIFFEPIKEGGLIPTEYAIAGGAIRDYLSDEEVKDIDVFCQTKEAEDKLIAFLEKEGEKMNENTQLANFKFKNRWIQIIKSKYYNMQTTEVIDSFDFTICGAMLVDDKFFSLPTFFQDTLAKHLRINKITFPLSTLERMQKYIKKGYEACNGTLLAVAKSQASVNFDNPSEDTLRFYSDGTPRFLGID